MRQLFPIFTPFEIRVYASRIFPFPIVEWREITLSGEMTLTAGRSLSD